MRLRSLHKQRGSFLTHGGVNELLDSKLTGGSCLGLANHTPSHFKTAVGSELGVVGLGHTIDSNVLWRAGPKGTPSTRVPGSGERVKQVRTARNGLLARTQSFKTSGVGLPLTRTQKGLRLGVRCGLASGGLRGGGLLNLKRP